MEKEALQNTVNITVQDANPGQVGKQTSQSQNSDESSCEDSESDNGQSDDQSDN